MNMLALFIGQPIGAKVSPFVLPTSRAQIFPQARSASGSFFMFSAAKRRAREREHFVLGLGGLPVVILSKVPNYP